MPSLDELGGDLSSTRIADVVFVHGLDGHPVSTWTTSKGDFWPGWLATDVPELAYWSLGYSIPSTQWLGTSLPLVDHALAALEYILARGLGTRPICFITHSMGGLLFKQMLRHACGLDDRFRGLPKQVRGVVFLSTPHAGSRVANLVRTLSFFYRATVAVRDLEHHDPHLRDLNLWYRRNTADLGIRNRIYYETLPTRGVLVVDALSADGGFPDCTPIPVEADHISICKPQDRLAPVYLSVKSFLAEILASLATRTPASRAVELRRRLLEAPGVFELRRLLHEANLIVAESPSDPITLALRDEVSGAYLHEASRTSRVANESLVQFLIRVAPVSPETSRALAEAVSSKLYSSLLGTIDVDPERPSSIFATRVTGRVDLEWKATSDELTSSATKLFSLGEPFEALHDAVTFREDGLVRLQAGGLPPDGTWRAFCLADGPDLSSALVREPFLLMRESADPFANPAGFASVNPYTMVDRGYLLEAWLTALDEGWPRHELLGLLVLLFAKMQLLITESFERAIPQLPALPDFIVEELTRIRRDDLPIRQQSIAEQLKGADGCNPVATP